MRAAVVARVVRVVSFWRGGLMGWGDWGMWKADVAVRVRRARVAESLVMV